MEEEKKLVLYTQQRVDTNHLLSKEQIEIIKTCTRPGVYISFHKGEELIEGVVKKVYSHLFIMEDGRSYTWIDYILGDPVILDYLRKYHPITTLAYDPVPNRYGIRMMRTN